MQGLCTANGPPTRTSKPSAITTTPSGSMGILGFTTRCASTAFLPTWRARCATLATSVNELHPRIRTAAQTPCPASRRAPPSSVWWGEGRTVRVSPRPSRRLACRREQLIRAERMRDLGLLDVLHPDRLSPDALTEWLARPKATPPRPRDLIDLDGLERLPRLLEEVLGDATHTAESVRHEGALQHVAG